MVQWLRLRHPDAGAHARSLVEELDACCSDGPACCNGDLAQPDLKKKKKNLSNHAAPVLTLEPLWKLCKLLTFPLSHPC